MIFFREKIIIKIKENDTIKKMIELSENKNLNCYNKFDSVHLPDKEGELYIKCVFPLSLLSIISLNFSFSLGLMYSNVSLLFTFISVGGLAGAFFFPLLIGFGIAAGGVLISFVIKFLIQNSSIFIKNKFFELIDKIEKLINEKNKIIIDILIKEIKSAQMLFKDERDIDETIIKELEDSIKIIENMIL